MASPVASRPIWVQNLDGNVSTAPKPRFKSRLLQQAIQARTKELALTRQPTSRISCKDDHNWLHSFLTSDASLWAFESATIRCKSGSRSFKYA